MCNFHHIPIKYNIYIFLGRKRNVFNYHESYTSLKKNTSCISSYFSIFLLFLFILKENLCDHNMRCTKIGASSKHYLQLNLFFYLLDDSMNSTYQKYQEKLVSYPTCKIISKFSFALLLLFL